LIPIAPPIRATCAGPSTISSNKIVLKEDAATLVQRAEAAPPK
jgi:hypothetical protein